MKKWLTLAFLLPATLSAQNLYSYGLGVWSESYPSTPRFAQSNVTLSDYTLPAATQREYGEPVHPQVPASSPFIDDHLFEYRRPGFSADRPCRITIAFPRGLPTEVAYPGTIYERRPRIQFEFRTASGASRPPIRFSASPIGRGPGIIERHERTFLLPDFRPGMFDVRAESISSADIRWDFEVTIEEVDLADPNVTMWITENDSGCTFFSAARGDVSQGPHTMVAIGSPMAIASPMPIGPTNLLIDPSFILVTESTIRWQTADVPPALTTWVWQPVILDHTSGTPLFVDHTFRLATRHR